MHFDLKWQKTDHLLPGGGAGEQECAEGKDYSGHMEAFGMIDMLTILIVLMVSWMHTYIRLIRLYA